jgi:xylulokinase
MSFSHRCPAPAGKLDAGLMSQIDMLCYCTFSPSPVLMREDGTLAYPNIVTHMDRRSRAQTDTILAKVGKDEFLNITGFYPFAGGAGVMTLLWFMENEPAVLRDVACFGHLPTYIHHKLTGLLDDRPGQRVHDGVVRYGHPVGVVGRAFGKA